MKNFLISLCLGLSSVMAADYANPDLQECSIRGNGNLVARNCDLVVGSVVIERKEERPDDITLMMSLMGGGLGNPPTLKKLGKQYSADRLITNELTLVDFEIVEGKLIKGEITWGELFYNDTLYGKGTRFEDDLFDKYLQGGQAGEELFVVCCGEKSVFVNELTKNSYDMFVFCLADQKGNKPSFFNNIDKGELAGKKLVVKGLTLRNFHIKDGKFLKGEITWGNLLYNGTLYPVGTKFEDGIVCQ